MDKPDSKNLDDTVRILRPPPKVFTDERGRTFWMCGVDPCELTLDVDWGFSTDPYDKGCVSVSLR